MATLTGHKNRPIVNQHGSRLQCQLRLGPIKCALPPQRCERLLRAHPVVFVHAVGRKCIPVAVNVAEQLREDAAAAAAVSGGQSKLVKVESYTQAVDITGEWNKFE